MTWNLGWGRHKADRCPEHLITRERMELIAVWNRWKRFGPPMEGGWAEWPARLVDLIEALDAESDALTRAEIESKREHPGDGR